MTVQINCKICDNVAECEGIKCCLTDALFWDEENKKISIDNNKCISCKRCEKNCPNKAIKVSSTQEEYDKQKNEIEKDPRKLSDLCIERYGSVIISPEARIEESELIEEMGKQTKPILLEIFTQESVKPIEDCVHIKDMVPREDLVFKKVKIKDKEKIPKEWNVRIFPSLLLFIDGNVMGKTEGYMDYRKKLELTKEVRDMIRYG
ncbi:MAG: 4Fe-4S binding protein [Nanoarchaeota archaeon]|nr:4Fe-4S binding protein [Nanoarchaeota archaeon]